MKPNINEQEFLDYYKSPAAPPEDDEPEIIEKPPRQSLLPFISVAILFLFAGLAAAGYFFFGSTPKSATVSFSIDGPKELAAGSEALLTLTIGNASNTPLSDTSLIISFPSGFSFTSASEEPRNSKKNYWALGTLNAFERRVILIRGTLAGNKGDRKIVSASFQYYQKGASAEFQVTSTRDIVLTSSSFAIHMTGPNSAQPGERVTYSLSIDTTGIDVIAEQYEIRVTPPHGFQLKEATPKPDHDFVWRFDGKSIALSGLFDDTTAQGSRVVEAVIGTKTGADFQPLSTATFETLLSASDIGRALLINGSAGPSPLRMDEPVAISIPIENRGTAPLTGVSVSLVISCPIIDWLTIENPNGGIIKSGTITWTDREMPSLKLLKSGEKANVRLSLRFKRSDDIPSALLAQTPDALAFSTTLSVKAAKLGAKDGALSEASIESQPLMLSVPINSDVAFTATENADGRVSWTVTNSLHELSRLGIEGKLANGAAWNDASTVQAGTLDYNEKTRTVSWSLNRMPTSVKALSIEFELRGPSSTAPLIQQQILTATDTKTGGKITIAR